MSNSQKLNSTIKEIEKILEARRPNPNWDAIEIARRTLGTSRQEIILNLGAMSISNNDSDKMIEIAIKVSAGFPLEYALGVTSFLGIDIKVTPDVLIPRPDTETLVLETEKIINGGVFKLIDVCTGSGCIAIALKKRNPQCEVTATDISPYCLKIAKKNAALNNTDINFLQADLTNNIKGKFDIITCNPPYIPTKEIPFLEKEISYEPISALDGGEDGLQYYRRLSLSIPDVLSEDGFAIIEADCPENETAKKLEKIFENYSFCFVPDISGNKRALKLWRKK
ncbi:MAG TPA: peptide chain release factor N(5)-glutamine methyltransferase [Caldisericia bacterium]|nr:peptide chain release factor N(5)-glutamine methyltransferase [Caldisericia bacterium]HUN18806.1 peptide chain release factor N(5)-glutamine methyltransferase [Caldisericia bacterium]